MAELSQLNWRAAFEQLNAQRSRCPQGPFQVHCVESGGVLRAALFVGERGQPFEREQAAQLAAFTAGCLDLWPFIERACQAALPPLGHAPLPAEAAREVPSCLQTNDADSRQFEWAPRHSEGQG